MNIEPKSCKHCGLTMIGSTADAAKLLDVTEKTIRMWIKDEGLPVLKLGKRGAGHSTTIHLPSAVSWHLLRKRTK